MQRPKILIYDLEITPTLGWTYGLFDTNVIHVERPPYILCFSYQWYGEKKVHCVAQIDFKGYKKHPYDDLEVTKKLWSLLNEADVVIAHNANRFDNLVANERFLVHRLGPPSPYKTVDTLQVARSKFKGGSNSLNNLCRKLEIGSKTIARHGDLWRPCVDGDMDAWYKMVRYCNQDVRLLKRLYEILRPFMTNHPNMANISGRPDSCPTCGHKKLHARGKAYTATGTYHRFQCANPKCGRWCRRRIADKKADKPTHVNVT